MTDNDIAISVEALAALTERADRADRNWAEYLGERSARMEANNRELAVEYWKARAEKAEADCANLTSLLMKAWGHVKEK